MGFFNFGLVFACDGLCLFQKSANENQGLLQDELLPCAVSQFNQKLKYTCRINSYKPCMSFKYYNIPILFLKQLPSEWHGGGWRGR